MDYSMIERLTVVGAILIVMTIIGLAGRGDYEDQRAQNEEYCFMVEMYRQSNGENGWPDFRGNYAEVCK